MITQSTGVMATGVWIDATTDAGRIVVNSLDETSCKAAEDMEDGEAESDGP